MLRTLAISIAVLCALAAPMDAQTALTAGTLKQCLGHRVTVRAIRPDLAMVTFKDGIQARLLFFKTPMAAERVWDDPRGSARRLHHRGLVHGHGSRSEVGRPSVPRMSISQVRETPDDVLEQARSRGSGRNAA